MEDGSSCPPGVGGVTKNQVTHTLIKDIVTYALTDMGYECPEKDLELFVRSATPSSSPTSSSTTTPASSQTSSHISSRSQSPSKGGKKRCASLLSEEETNSDSTVVGSEEGAESDSDNSTKSQIKVTINDNSFTLVKIKKPPGRL
ncbi:hypothetical protein EVAR_46380_1 [Eumeta japonica]|uniref:Uncharacterized protein n=1 Tax=Eumeta variegata TaxID=151549 RepID=A0A4C1WVZ6_EUMVA|nr:hypothetical protein EVAR_46380_1 [Eumeta japonica]